MNFVYENIAKEEYQKIKLILSENIGNPKIENIKNCSEAIKYSNTSGSLNIKYYKTKKVMIQGNFRDIETIIEKIKKSLKLTPKGYKLNESQVTEGCENSEIIFGFDEAGKGETFGSLFLGVVEIINKNVDYLKGMLGRKDVKKMNLIQIENFYNAIKGKFKHKVKQISPKEIDSLQLNIIMDRGYIELIKSFPNSSNNQAMFLDDYGIGHELNEKLTEIRKNGIKVVVLHGADKKYLACSIASLVARRARLLEMDRLSKEHILINPESGKKVGFKSGSPSNPETEKYLVTYRKLYPNSDFPNFVRMKWGNVRKIESEFPKKEISLSFKCKYCNEEGHKICLIYNNSKSQTECFCSQCGKEIDPIELKGFFKNKNIVIDTSTIISRIISKDFETNLHFEGCNFIIPSMLYEELDSKQPIIKAGGTKEIQALRKLNDEGKANLIDFDVEDYSDVANDKKFLRVIRAKDGIMLTKDWNLASFSEIGDFVIHIIEDKKSYLKKMNIE